MEIEVVKNNLDQNEFLTDDVKADLFELTLLFHENYKDISLETLAQRLLTVQIEVISKFLSQEVAVYNEKTNRIQINKNELEKTNNTKYILMVALVHMIIPDENDPNNLLVGLKEGYAKLLANNLVGSEVA